MTPLRTLALVLLAGVFLRAGFAPVATLDSWADWKYGQWIWENRQLPSHEPFSAYSDQKIPLRDGSWLSEVTYYVVVSRAGLEGVALLHALLETTKAGLFLLAVRRLTGSLGTAIAMTLLMEAVCWPYFGTIRTTVPAEVCWAGLLLICSARVPSRAAVIATPLLFALWANLSPSFGFGLLLLGGMLLGRFLEGVRSSRRLTRAAREPAVARMALMLGLAVVAVCCNPYGVDHLQDAFGMRGLSVVDARLWPKLIPVDSWESRVVIASVVVVLVVLRLSPRSWTPAEVFLMAAFAGWSWYDKRVAPWWLMLAPWLLAPDFKAMFDKISVRESLGSSWRTPLHAAITSYIFLTIAAVLLWVSPTVQWAIGRPIPRKERIGPLQPTQSATLLAERSPEAPGRHVLTLPYWWSDYLLWSLPAGDQMFWYSRPESWMRLKSSDRPGNDPTPAEWRKLVESYHLDTLVVRAESAEGLRAYLDEQPQWLVMQDDSHGLIAVRRNNP